jgi:hypothetical protein
MLQDNFQPIASERTPAACDFTDRLLGLNHDVLTIELAVQSACRDGDEEGGQAIVQQCRKLRMEIDELADMVLPALEGRRP